MDQIYKRPDFSSDRFDRDPGLSYTIPARLYFDPDVLEEERHKIFWKSWMPVCHASDVAEKGTYATVEISGQHIAVVRGHDGKLRGFFNVCQHRGHLLLEGTGKIKNVITCPYHAWAYGDDGHLVAAPHCESVAGFDKRDFTLPQVVIEEFFGFIFVNLDPRAKSMGETYAGLAEELAGMCANPGELKKSKEVIFDIKGNWKNVADNALECYHCSPAHHAFVDLVDMDTYQIDTHKYWSYQVGKCRARNTAYDFEAAEKIQDHFKFYFLWPCLTFSVFPGCRGIFMFSFVPTGPELTHQVFAHYSPDGTVNETEQAALDYFRDVLGPEDVSLVESVQKGLHSLGYHQGRFIIDAARNRHGEHTVHHFHTLVMDALGL